MTAFVGGASAASGGYGSDDGEPEANDAMPGLEVDVNFCDCAELWKYILYVTLICVSFRRLLTT